MVFYNFSREVKDVARYKKYKEFNADIIFMDCFHNINVIRFKNGKKCKNTILEYIGSRNICSINELNKYLREGFNLYAYSLCDNIRTLYYYEINVYNEVLFKTYYNLDIYNLDTNTLNNNDRFSDLD